MLVCSCRAVNDSAVRAAILAGATSVDEVGTLCNAGTRCGGCRPTIDALLGTCDRVVDVRTVRTGCAA